MTSMPKNFTVWTEIPVSDLGRAKDYYEAVTGGELDVQQMGPDKTAVFKVADPEQGVAGHLYEGKPAADGQGPTIHLAVSGKLEDAIDRVWKAGGTVLSEPIPIPAGRFAYTKDPDGNSIGLFETP